MTLNIAESAQRLIKAATGEPYGDGMIITDVGQGISEPGYGDENTVWAFGDWNPKRFRKNDEPPLTNEESLPMRLGNALERIGVETLWCDEWATCSNCYQAIRTQPNSYMWQPNFVSNPDENFDGYYCLDCFEKNYSNDDSGLWDFEYVNNPNRCVPDALANNERLEAWGWTKHNGIFENGWHPGQTDNPREIFERLEKDYDVIFRLDETSQFYITFTAWIKNKEEEE